MELITLTTDFGQFDGYPAVMKGVILNINPSVRIIDITHNIQPQNIVQGAFILYSILDYYPSAVHVGVIDPGVGSVRNGLIIKCKNSYLVGPDNGLLVPAAEKLGIKGVYKILDTDYCLKNVSSTFHGRDIFAPVAAHITKGVPCNDLGEDVDEYIYLDIFKVEKTDNHLVGQVLNIDHFGNIITNIPQKLINQNFDPDAELSIEIEDKGQAGQIVRSSLPFKNTYSDVALGDCVCIISSSGFLEIASNQSKANELLNLQLSSDLIIRLKI